MLGICFQHERAGGQTCQNSEPKFSTLDLCFQLIYNTQVRVGGTSKTRSSQDPTKQSTTIQKLLSHPGSQMGLEFSESCPIGIGNQLQTVTRIRFLRPRTYITFRLRSVLNLGSVIISVFLSFLNPSPFQYQRKKSKNASTTFFCHTPRRFVKWMLQQEEIRSRRNPPCQPQPTVHQTNWLIRWANSWCRCAKKSPVPKT